MPQNSNLVLQADRSLIDRRNKDEATGEVQTLAGKLSGVRMGERAQRALPPELAERRARRSKKAERADDRKAARLRGSLLDSTDIGVRYQPKTRETQRAYEILLTLITNSIGSQPRDVLCGAADEILEILKNEHTQMKQKQREMEDILGSLDESALQQFHALGAKITDFTVETEQAGDEEAIDEELGVAVVFEQSDVEVGAGGRGGG